MTQPIDPSVIIGYAEILTKDAARCRELDGPVSEHGPTPYRCKLPPHHPGDHDFGKGTKR